MGMTSKSRRKQAAKRAEAAATAQREADILESSTGNVTEELIDRQVNDILSTPADSSRQDSALSTATSERDALQAELDSIAKNKMNRGKRKRLHEKIKAANKSIKTLEEDVENERQGTNREELEANEIDALLSGNKEDILESKHELAQLGQLEKTLGDQIREKAERERNLFREEERAKRAEIDLGLQRDALGRQEAGLDRNLASINLQAEQFQTDLTRERGMTRRAGRIAANSAQQANAQSANLAAQSGFGSSSALLGQQASNRTAAGTKAGDILTGLTTLQSQETAGLANIADARAGISDQSKIRVKAK